MDHEVMTPGNACHSILSARTQGLLQIHTVQTKVYDCTEHIATFLSLPKIELGTRGIPRKRGWRVVPTCGDSPLPCSVNSTFLPS